jgi:Tol biopolymer transport system component
MRFRSVLIVVAAIVAVLMAARPGGATFPGMNGRIAFIKTVDSLSGAVGDIYTVKPDGSDMKQVTSFNSNVFGAGWVGWSPNSQQLVFQLFNLSTFQGQLWLVNADGSNQHLLLNDPLSFDDAHPSFSPDGSQIVFSRCRPTNCAVFRVQADGTGLTAITHFSVNSDVNDLYPVYSPDGKTIAFTGFFRDGVLCAIYLADADGSNIRRLTPPGLEAWGADWSPDGGKITFATNSISAFSGTGLDEEIWVIKADGTKATRLTSNNQHFKGYFAGPHDGTPSWSPQGDAIVFERDAPDFSSSAIYIMNPDGSGAKPIREGLAGRSAMADRATRSGKRTPKDLMRTLLEPEGIIPRWGTATN